MKKPNEGKTEVINFEEFIDIITDSRGEEIKRQLEKIKINSKPRNNTTAEKKPSFPDHLF